MQVCTLLQTDNHTGTPPLCFLQAGCPSCRPTNSVKALTNNKNNNINNNKQPFQSCQLTKRLTQRQIDSVNANEQTKYPDKSSLTETVSNNYQWLTTYSWEVLVRRSGSLSRGSGRRGQQHVDDDVVSGRAGKWVSETNQSEYAVTNTTRQTVSTHRRKTLAVKIGQFKLKEVAIVQLVDW